jgi:signal transduction histidine kinase
MLHLFPLVSRGEPLGVVEIVAPDPVIDDRLPVLEAVIGYVAAVLRNARELTETQRALSGLRASVELAAELLRAGSPERALSSAVNLCHQHLRVPVLGWLPVGDEGVVVLRGVGTAKRRMAREILLGLDRQPPAEAIGGVARALAPVAGRLPIVARAGDGALAAFGAIGEAGGLLLDTVGGLLGDALRTIGVVTEAQARSDGMDLGIAWTAHELRGPLIGARAAIDHLMSGDGHAPPSDLLRGTRDELENLASLVDPLLRWSAGSGQLHKRRTDLVKIVGDAIASCDLGVGEGRTSLLAPPALELRADPRQLRIAVANLVRNALEYSPAGTRVIVEVGRTESVAWVCVRDRGSGIPRREHELIFDPFARGRAGRTSRGGAGLGLFITRRVVEAHGGTVRLLPSGRGAVFCLELPVAAGKGVVRSAS